MRHSTRASRRGRRRRAREARARRGGRRCRPSWPPGRAIASPASCAQWLEASSARGRRSPSWPPNAASRCRSPGFDFEVTFDRLDRLDDGTAAIVDYKSGRACGAGEVVRRASAGRAAAGLCRGLRGRARRAGRLTAVAFAQVRPGESARSASRPMRHAGPAWPKPADAASCDDVPDWAAALAHWSHALEHLAQDLRRRRRRRWIRARTPCATVAICTPSAASPASIPRRSKRTVGGARERSRRRAPARARGRGRTRRARSTSRASLHRAGAGRLGQDRAPDPALSSRCSRASTSPSASSRSPSRARPRARCASG